VPVKGGLAMDASGRIYGALEDGSLVAWERSNL